MPPFWSVVIPLYNKQDFIETTLRSVLAQVGEGDFEVIVVNDGSSDDGALRVAAIDDSRIRLIQQANAGVSAARNRGIREAKGDWVVFLDADDLLHPNALQTYRYLAATFPASSVLAGRDVRVNSFAIAAHRFGPLPEPLPTRLVENLPSVFLVEGLPFSSSSVSIRRNFLVKEALTFAEGESMGEDLDVWLRAAEKSTVACTRAGLVVYRVGLASSLMGSYRDLALLPVWQRLRQRALTGEMPRALRSSSLRLSAEMEVTLARRLAVAGKRGEAWRHLIAARAAAKGHRWWVTMVAIAFHLNSLLILRGRTT